MGNGLTLPEDFDAGSYLELNPDVRRAGVGAVEHYVAHGRREGRRYRAMPLTLRPLLDQRYDQDGLNTRHNHDFMMDETFCAAYARGAQAAGQDYGWHWRVHIGLWAARSALRVPGDFVECGVNRGFLSSAIMHALDWDATGRLFYLLDTFAGLDECLLSQDEAAGGVAERGRRELQSGFYTDALEAVRGNFAEWTNVQIVPGSVPGTLAQVRSEEIAFLHLDMNCSQPEVAAIDALWPRMSGGGMVLLDDYAYYGYQTQKLAVDEWAAANGVPVASLPTGQGVIVKI